MTLRTGVPSTISARVGVDPEKMMIVSASPSDNWCFSSRGEYKGLTLTCMAPARITPNMPTAKASVLGAIMATRSPFFTPSSLCR